ncbi:zinc finger protein 181-like [Oppia nitens]|uniref:zinc finger protein 181-like n=1 Tax=Oppia nitens TaxID=1686743 RepID=UPI0023DA4BAA|nr:zinc finger protein 181-like [Oppia nitens]
MTMLSISDEHKEVIIRLVNDIVSDTPLITNLTDRSKVSNKLVKLIHWFERSVNSGAQSLSLLRCVSFEALIENWLLDYYCEESVMDSFDIEEGIEHELSTAALLILYVVYKFSVCFPHIVMYFNDSWHQMQEFNTKLDQMLQTDKIIQLLYQQIDDKTNDNEEKRVLPMNDLIGKSDDCTNQRQSQGNDICMNNGSTDAKANRHENYSSFPSTSTTNETIILPQVLDIPTETPFKTNTNNQTTKQLFVCNYCYRCFQSNYKLKRHEFVHKPQNKPFTCHWQGCDLRFRSSFDMRRHMVTHTGERPFSCNICDKRFSRADKLKEHKSIHLKKSEELLAKQQMDDELPLISDNKDTTNLIINFEPHIQQSIAFS